MKEEKEEKKVKPKKTASKKSGISAGSVSIAWKAISPFAKIPSKAHDDDAGFDLYSNEDVTILPHQTKLVKTGISAQLIPPDGWNAFLEIKDTSGNAYKLNLSTKAGVIDIGYDGNIGVVIRNNNMLKTIKIKKGAKIAQAIPFLIPKVEEHVWKNKKTERGDDGYGSSGIATD